jgi:tetratricopeptide (TPR) repeat protein
VSHHFRRGILLTYLSNRLTKVMEDLAVVNNWHISTTAALCALAIVAEPVLAGPANMTMKRQPVAATQSQPAVSAASLPTTSQPIAAGPRTQASPLRNPIKYLSKAIGDNPIRTATLPNHPAAIPAQAPVRNDAIALTTPTGPPTPQLVISIAQLCEQRGDFAQARQHYQRALAQWPGQPDVLRAAARMEDRLGQFSLAESLYQGAVAGRPGDAGALNDLGLCLARSGKLDQSLAVLEQAIHLQPDKALYRNNAAMVLVEMRQDQRAMAHLACVHGPAETQFNMGQLLVARSRATEAEAYFEKALDVDPNLEAARVALNQLPGNQPRQEATPQVAAQTPKPQPPAVADQRPATSATPAAPAATPPTGQQLGPQMIYPGDSRTSSLGRPGFVPSPYQPPVGPYPSTATAAQPQPSVPWVGQATPRALPPVERR